MGGKICFLQGSTNRVSRVVVRDVGGVVHFDKDMPRGVDIGKGGRIRLVNKINVSCPPNEYVRAIRYI